MNPYHHLFPVLTFFSLVVLTFTTAFTILPPQTHVVSNYKSHNWWKSNPSGTGVSFSAVLSSSWKLSSSRENQEKGGEEGDEGEASNAEGFSLAADFQKILQQRNIQLNQNDLLDDDDEEEDSDDEDDFRDEEQITNQEDIPSLSDQQVYRELDERVLETAGGFVDLLSKSREDDDDDDDDDNEDNLSPKVYEPPTTIPDPELTAGEVVMTVLNALNHNDEPMPDYGIVVLFGYSSPGSAIAQAIDIEGMTPAEYGAFLKEEYEYKILFQHVDAVIEKGDYSADKKKSFFTARLQAREEEGGGFTNVNFILSASEGDEDGAGCWMIDSLLIRPEGMRRRRRK